jgi:hypothetical protein
MECNIKLAGLMNYFLIHLANFMGNGINKKFCRQDKYPARGAHK